MLCGHVDHGLTCLWPAGMGLKHAVRAGPVPNVNSSLRVWAGLEVFLWASARPGF